MATEIEEVVKFYKGFNKYKQLSNKLLINHVAKSFEYKQYKIHRENDKIVAFTNWIFLNQEHEKYFQKYGIILDHFWNSGDKCWVIDSITEETAFKKVWSWGKKYFAGELGLDYISWLRVRDYRVTNVYKKYKKEAWINGK
jgi:hemolysin-activating ACP:hemolysin acyltransferase